MLKTKPDDRVVFFAAGHGLLDDNLDFYYATHDIDFYNPTLRGLSYEYLEDLPDSIPARHKLLMIDACHSGYVDKPELTIVSDSITLADGSRAGIHTYGYKRDVTDIDYSLIINNTFELMQQLFTDFSYGSGTVIIVASAGDGYALELHNIEHGVFTWCVMEGIQKGYADKNHDKSVSVNELKEYVLKAVIDYTGGQQKSAVRNESIDYDFNPKSALENAGSIKIL